MATQPESGTWNSANGDEVISLNSATIPWGIYTPPSSFGAIHEENTVRDSDSLEEHGLYQCNGHHHGGYVRIIDAKGKSFPCSFSRPVGTVIETVVCKKRSRSQLTSPSNDSECGENNDNQENEIIEDQHKNNNDKRQVRQQKKTITELRLHPEEALFLHTRGLFRIEFNCNEENPTNDSVDQSSSVAMPTQDLFCKMLPECKIPLAAYLAYAHLRAQGYNMIRYSDQRMKLIRSMNQFDQKSKKQMSTLDKEKSTKSENGEVGQVPLNGSESSSVYNESIDIEDMSKENYAAKTISAKTDEPSKDEEMSQDLLLSDNGGCSISTSSYYPRLKLRQLYSKDVATAPPPCVVSLETWNRDSKCGTTGNLKPQLAYYAYNPNARFRRSNPGLPDFGVAILPYHSDGGRGPTFDTISLFVSMCEGTSELDENESMTEQVMADAGIGIPLRIATVSDGGAVIAFSVTRGDVPNICQQKL